MTGSVRKNLIFVPLEVRGPTAFHLDVDLVLDTGFSGELTLPANVVPRLALDWHSTVTAKVADGALVDYEVYRVEISWNGEWRRAKVWAGKDMMMGMALLTGHRLTVDCVPNGPVEITPLP